MIATIQPMRIEIEADNSMMEMTIKEAQIKLQEIVQKVNDDDERVILTENGEQKAVIISVEAFAFLHRMIEKIEDEIDLAEAEKILAETKPEDYIPFEVINQELGEE